VPSPPPEVRSDRGCRRGTRDRHGVGARARVGSVADDNALETAARVIAVAIPIAVGLYGPGDRHRGRADRRAALPADGAARARYPTPARWVVCSSDCPPNAFMAVAREPKLIERVVIPVREALTTWTNRGAHRRQCRRGAEGDRARSPRRRPPAAHPACGSGSSCPPRESATNRRPGHRSCVSWAPTCKPPMHDTGVGFDPRIVAAQCRPHQHPGPCFRDRRTRGDKRRRDREPESVPPSRSAARPSPPRPTTTAGSDDLLAGHGHPELALAVVDELTAEVDGHGVQRAGEAERGPVVGADR
jgi:hypothetical protein